MCLLFLIFKKTSYRPGSLLLVSVRDEDFLRETERGQVKEGSYAPRDVEAGGTWFSYNKNNYRFAVVLNHHGGCDTGEQTTTIYDNEEKISRGSLPEMFTQSDITVTEFVDRVKKILHKFNGFNIIFGDSACCYYLSNKCQQFLSLVPNVLHGFSNGSVDANPCEWPRIGMGKTIIESILPSLDGMSEMDIDNFNRILDDLADSFKKEQCEKNVDAATISTPYERLIIPPTVCERELFGSRTLIALLAFMNDEPSDSDKSNVCILESDLDPHTNTWSDVHVVI